MNEVGMYFFGLLIFLSGLTLIFTENLIYAAFLLALCLLSIAGFYVIYNASFLAVIQILIYAGGILILIAFGIMLTNRSPDGKVTVGYHLLFFGSLVTLGMALLIYALMGSSTIGPQEVLQTTGQVKEIGLRFLTQYILAFELIAFLLLVVLVGASYLGKKSQHA
jgi:NADH:ubiquinone oxidoreductase subunit 6 (subunit J)|tara:strand:+ start:4141 stop:4635 length:495 start_codon:yes stop_codon:yes gene_type:complete